MAHNVEPNYMRISSNGLRKGSICMPVEVVKENCMGCGICVETCPFASIDMEDGIAKVDPEKCKDCNKCVKACPATALKLDKNSKKVLEEVKDETIERQNKGPNDSTIEFTEEYMEGNANPLKGEYAEYRGVWVFIEQVEGEIAPVSWELLGEGRKLADKLKVDLSGVLLGHDIQKLANEVFAYGAEKLYVIDDPVLKDYRTEPYKDGLVALINKHKPEIFLMGATTMGRDLSGAVATELRTGLTADCTILDINPKEKILDQTRPAFGGNIMATIWCKKRRPQMATVRPRVMAMPERTEQQGELILEEFDAPLEFKEESVATKVIEFIKEEGAAVYLDKAEIIIAGGRGVGSKKNWETYIEGLAKATGGTVGATRAAVEAGWISMAHQIGQTGQTVRPKVYFALGVSGAIQHLVGMDAADCIVAINSDPDAPIFNVANYGIVGDMFKIVPELIEEFKKQLG